MSNHYCFKYRIFKHLATCFVVCLLFTTAGCGTRTTEKSYAKLDLTEVTGTVMMNGTPMPNVQIQFLENGSFSYGVTDAAGKYRMFFDSSHSGVKPGKKSVRLWTTMQGPGFDEKMQGNYPTKETIPVQYNHESKLTADVESGKSTTLDFDLKSGGKTKNAPLNEG